MRDPFALSLTAGHFLARERSLSDKTDCGVYSSLRREMSDSIERDEITSFTIKSNTEPSGFLSPGPGPMFRDQAAQACSL
jgi:hypothetical protein